MARTMNQDVKRQWMEALRSGRYSQGEGHLCVSGAFCCLGVLCDLAAKQGIGKWLSHGDEYAADFIVTTIDGDIVQSDTAVPTPDVLLWAGLSDGNPFAGDHTLAEYNDGSQIYDIRKHSFAEIADLIDRYL